MNAPRDTRQILTASRLKVARGCRRQHHNAFDLGIKSAAESEAARFGTLVHLGLEAWWRATGDERLSMALAAMQVEADAFDRVRAEEMLRGYHFRWGGEPYEVLGVESQFVCDLVNPTTSQPSRTWRLAGKIDVIVRDPRDGLVRTVEHKTSSENILPGSDYWRRLRMDGQVSVYFVGAASLGLPAAACLYDVLGKPGQRPFKATPLEDRKFKKDGTLYANQHEADETPEAYRARLREAIATDPGGHFQRGDVVRLGGDLDEAMLDIWQLAQELREASLAGRFPKNPGNCVQYGRTCPYFAACSGEASLDDPGLFRRVDNIHPELALEAAQSHP